jgi:hypothetical protein
MERSIGDILRSKGVHVSERWIQQCLRYMQSNAHLPYLKFGNLNQQTPAQLADSVYGLVLTADFHEIYAEQLPLANIQHLLEMSVRVPVESVYKAQTLGKISFSQAMSWQHLTTPGSFIIEDVFVLQCDEIANIGSTFDAVQQQKQSEQPTTLNSRQRLLKLFLTDGFHKVKTTSPDLAGNLCISMDRL